MNLQLTRRALFLGASAFAMLGCTSEAATTPAPADETRFEGAAERTLTPAQWRARLSPAAFNVLRQEGTERPGTSPLLREHRHGVFACAGCALPLFQSDWKFESGTGWPSFYRGIDANIGQKTDFTFGMTRTEYHCARCLGHQGHIFNDGPQPTGLRYCNNGVALTFTPS